MNGNATLGEFKASAALLVESFNAFILKHRLASDVAADHICYKCETSEKFESLRELLEFESRFIYQSIISKRRIAIIKFKEPFHSQAGPIWYLELSDQKPDGSQKEGWDHVEIIPAHGSFDELVVRLSTAGENVVRVERPHHTTYDIELADGRSIKLSKEFLVDKIKREEMA